MSQVIPNHVLRVGQTICLSSKEEMVQLGHGRNRPGCLPVSSAGCHYGGGSGDHWLRDCSIIHSSDKKVFRYDVQGKGSVSHMSGHSGPSYTGTPPGDSPTLDISIDNLNQLILDLDPSFQPLGVCKGGKTTRGQNDEASVRTAGAQDAEVKLISRGTSSQDTLSTKSRSVGLPIPQRSPKERSCSTSGSLIFSSSPTGPSASPSPHCFRQAGPCKSKECGFGDPPLSPMNLKGHRQRVSEISLLSTSPGSDTSYILGSSHSLLSEDMDGPERRLGAASGSLYGSTGSFANLNSPYLRSPGPQKTFSDQGLESFASRPQQPSISSFHHGRHSFSPPHLKGHSSSCPPSVTSSLLDIPVVLINGSPENDDLSCGRPEEGRATKKTGVKSPCKASSTSTLHGTSPDGQPTMKFVMDTSKYWFKPQITREQADTLLKDKVPGSFIVRDSTSYRGSFGLVMKVHDDSPGGEPLKHYLIESSARGVRIKGASEEPFFGSLSALVYQHAITTLALPCKLLISTSDFVINDEQSQSSSGDQEKKSATCNLLYLNSVNTEALTGPVAVQKAVSCTFKSDPLPTPTIVNFKVSQNGITLTDVQRRQFFRKHFHVSTLSFCGPDPEDRKWQKNCKSARIFGFVGKSQDNNSENLCHLFAEYDSLQPASVAIDLVRGLLAKAD
ncbi:tensin-4-like [Polypterus senegalus]|uniref:tensin-4-like n=1 Tax=Polypterus senegalus TaxID=55291 RepID=UPI001964930B|nr:tensin-4-like [Polypterus senegalus]